MFSSTRREGKFYVIFPFSNREEENAKQVIFRGKKKTIYTTYIYCFRFPVGHGGKKGGLKLCPPSFLPLAMTKEIF
jgi:hypothetical protein